MVGSTPAWKPQAPLLLGQGKRLRVRFDIPTVQPILLPRASSPYIAQHFILPKIPGERPGYLAPSGRPTTIFSVSGGMSGVSCTPRKANRHFECFQESVQGILHPRKGQQLFCPNPNGVANRTTTLRRLLVFLFFSNSRCPRHTVLSSIFPFTSNSLAHLAGESIPKSCQKKVCTKELGPRKSQYQKRTNAIT